MKNERPCLKNQLERSHNISVLFDCKLPQSYAIQNDSKDEHTAGFLKWFDHVQEKKKKKKKDIYGEFLTNQFNKE